MPEKLTSVVYKFYDEYMNSTSKRLKIVDSYLLYIFLTGVFQFCYCALVGTFPFNSFLSGFISAVGSFVIAGNDNIFLSYCLFLLSGIISIVAVHPAVVCLIPLLIEVN